MTHRKLLFIISLSSNLTLASVHEAGLPPEPASSPSSAAATDSSEVVKYRCSGNRLVTVEYSIAESSTPASIHLRWSGRRYRLNLVPDNNDETRYVSQQMIWRTRNERGFLSTRGGRLLASQCEPIKQSHR
ncbi:MliC family protein [Neisseriaceae bacterium TC5R-5]|nr:MliC family protein [Neisseriaceae bacterium TC5R-5]